MSATISGDCGCGCDGQIAFPSNPSTALNFHFGMLLGVEDLRAEQGFHIGRLDRHLRELHGYGVTRGMAVRYDPDTGILTLHPGFAIDQQGRAIALDRPRCLDLVAWVEENRSRLPMLADVATGVDLDLIISAGSCLERPVQAIAPECNGSGADTAYSRRSEQPHPELVAATNPEPPSDPLGDVLDQLASGSFTPDPTRPEEQRLADLAALVAGGNLTAAAGMARQALLVASMALPAPLSGAVLEDNHLLLARLEGVRRVETSDRVSVTIAAIRCDLRPLLPPQAMYAPRQPQLPDAAPPGIGPQVSTATRNGPLIEIAFDRAVAPGSLRDGAFQILELTDSDLTAAPFTLAPSGPAGAPTGAVLTLQTDPAGLLRLVVFGTGPSPVVDPAFNALGQRPGTDGQNFVTTL